MSARPATSPGPPPEGKRDKKETYHKHAVRRKVTAAQRKLRGAATLVIGGDKDDAGRRRRSNPISLEHTHDLVSSKRVQRGRHNGTAKLSSGQCRVLVEGGKLLGSSRVDPMRGVFDVLAFVGFFQRQLHALIANLPRVDGDEDVLTSLRVLEVHHLGVVVFLVLGRRQTNHRGVPHAQHGEQPLGKQPGVDVGSLIDDQQVRRDTTSALGRKGGRVRGDKKMVMMSDDSRPS